MNDSRALSPRPIPRAGTWHRIGAGWTCGPAGRARVGSFCRSPTCVALVALWLVSINPLLALDSERPADSYSIRGWYAEHGLPSDKIRAVAQTRVGYLWIATAHGIARFDGSRFTAFTGSTNPELRGDGFFAVLEAPDGSLWFGGDNGLFRWRNGRFDRFTTEQGLAHNYVRALALTRDGAVVACCRTGYSIMRDGRLTTPGGVWKQATGVTRSYLERADGTILLGTDEGLWRISGETIERLSGPGGPIPGIIFTGLLETPDRTLWIGYNLGVRCIHPDGTKEDFGAARGLTAPKVAALRFDHNGNLWIGTYGGGLYRLARGRSQVEAAAYPEHFGGMLIQQVTESREGALWVATAMGLFRLTDNVSSTIGTARGLAQTSVYPVLEASDGLWWIGLWGGGVYRYDQTRAVPLKVPASTGIDRVLSLAEEPAGTMWIGALSGLYRHTGDTTVNLYQPAQAAAGQKLLAEKSDTVLPGLAHPRVNSIAADGAGGLWVATDGALYHGREGGFRAYTTADGLPGNDFKSVIRTRAGDIWASAPPGGVACFHAGSWTTYLCGQALSNMYPHAVYEDDAGGIWVTTEGGGLNRFKDGLWRIFSTRDGLIDDFISAIVEDGAGNFWISCPRGIMRVPQAQFDQPDTGRGAGLQPQVFDRSDGLPATDGNFQGSPAAWRTRDGRLLFSSERGVAVIEPAQLKSNSFKPPLYVERLVINGVDADLSHPVVAPPGSNDIAIHYTAINLLAPEKVHFKIRLAPLDPDWVDTGTRRDVRYAKLPPGDYTFQVIASKSDGAWNKDGVTAAFTVRPFFYQTGWFIALATVAGLGLVLGIFQVRERALRSARDRLEQRVEERTAKLAEASGLLEAMLENSPDLIYFKDRGSRFVRFSKACLPHFGLTESAMLRGKTDADFFAADHAQPASADEQQIIRTGVPIVGKLEKETYPDRHIAWVLTTKMPWRDGGGAIVGTFGITRDVTALKEAENKLAYERDQLRALLDSSPDMIYFKDTQSRFVLVSRSKVQQVLEVVPDLRARRAERGFPTDVPERELLTGLTDFDTYRDEDARLSYEHEQRIMRTGEGTIGQLERQMFREGLLHWCLSSKMPWRDPEGKIIGIFGISKDITDLKETEKKLAYQRDQLRALLDSIPDEIYFKDNQSRFVLVSRSKVQTTGTRVPDLRARRTARGLPADVPEPELLTGLTDFDTYRDDDARRAYEDEQEIVRTGEAIIGKLEKQAFQDGTVRWSLTSKMPWRDPEGRIVGTFGISKDITNLKEAEEKLEQMHRQLMETSRQAGMAEIATGVLHNVGNVLNSVNVSATLVAEQVRHTKALNIAKLAVLFDEHKADLVGFLTNDSRGQMIPAYLGTLAESLATEQETLITEIEHLRKNVEHIKDIVAMQQAYAKTSGVIETIAVLDMVEDALRINTGSLARHSVDILRDYQARPAVTTDKYKVMQILINLVRNAKYACDESGRIDKLITVRTTCDEHTVKIAIIDNGVGIPAENLTRIFSHGFTTRKEGHGFGLHSGALAAREIGGSLTAQSDGPGLGAAFTLEIPYKNGASP